MSERKPCKTDVSDEQRALVGPVITAWKDRHRSVGGQHGAYDMWEIVNAILYRGRTDCQWACLPHDLPQKSAAASYRGGLPEVPGVPGEAVAAARDTLGGAADTASTPPTAEAERLTAAAHTAFTDAVAVTGATAAALLVAAAATTAVVLGPTGGRAQG